MIPRILVVVLLGSVTALAAPVPKELKKKPDAERMQGLWKVDSETSYWLFQGHKLFAGGTDTPDKNGHTYEIAVRTESAPGEFDLTGGSEFAGICRFVGDDLHVAYSPGKGRPANFTTASNKHVLKRVPERKK